MNTRVNVFSDKKDQEFQAISKYLAKGLTDFNPEQLGRVDLVVSIHDGAGKIRGGLMGEVFWGWFSIKLLWLSEELRGKGYGTRILREAEREARNKGCKYAWLDTFSFQARPFYEKNGYTVFGTLNDYPPGHCRYFMQKALSSTAQTRASCQA